MEYHIEYLGSNKVRRKYSNIDCNAHQVGIVHLRNTLRDGYRVHRDHGYIHHHIRILVHMRQCILVGCILVQDFNRITILYDSYIA